MSSLNCYNCRVRPLMKCRKCLLKFCDSCLGTAYRNQGTSYLCKPCYTDWETWVGELDVSKLSRKDCLVCMLNSNEYCRQCHFESCEKHIHNDNSPVDCPTFNRWIKTQKAR